MKTVISIKTVEVVRSGHIFYKSGRETREDFVMM